MDGYEATRVVFSRIQGVDPDNAAKIMGLLLLQDHGEKEMIRLAFGPEHHLHSVLTKARQDLRLLPSAPRIPPPPLTVASPSWAPPSPFSDKHHSVAVDTLSPHSPFHGLDLADELQLHDHLSYPDECPSPAGSAYGMGWGGVNANVNGHDHLHHHRRSFSDLCLAADPAGAGLGWRPCLYFARGYCKNGSTCRFLHDNSASAIAAAGGVDALVEQQCQELLLRSKSPRVAAASQLMASASASAFPYSPTGTGGIFQNDSSQRAAAAAAALMLAGDDRQKFMPRSRCERSDYALILNPGSRQIYLTFPADSTFREEDVSNYFSIYGPVQDVRIPYQQKRMFGFVTFLYPETVKLILAKGNPHFVCDARVLVKPYKEKGRVPDKYRKQQLQDERVGDFSGCPSPTALDHLQQMGARTLFSSQSQETLLQKHHAAQLQQAIMGLQLLDLNNSSSPAHTFIPHTNFTQEEVAASEETRRAASGTTTGLSQAAINKVVNTPGVDKEESEGSPSDDSDFQESVEHNLPDSPFASPTKASTLIGHNTFLVDNNAVSSPLLYATPSFNSCFFQMPRLSSDQEAIGM